MVLVLFGATHLGVRPADHTRCSASKEQENESFSIPAQLKLPEDYAGASG
jgi:hypothetical protein